MRLDEVAIGLMRLGDMPEPPQVTGRAWIQLEAWSLELACMEGVGGFKEARYVP